METLLNVLKRSTFELYTFIFLSGGLRNTGQCISSKNSFIVPVMDPLSSAFIHYIFSVLTKVSQGFMYEIFSLFLSFSLFCFVIQSHKPISLFSQFIDFCCLTLNLSLKSCLYTVLHQVLAYSSIEPYRVLLFCHNFGFVYFLCLYRTIPWFIQNNFVSPEVMLTVSWSILVFK